MILYFLVYFIGFAITGILLGFDGADHEESFWFVVLWPLTLIVILVCLPFLLLTVLVHSCLFIGSKIRKRK